MEPQINLSESRLETTAIITKLYHKSHVNQKLKRSENPFVKPSEECWPKEISPKETSATVDP